MGRSRETFGKKEVRNKKEKKRKAKEERRQAKKEEDKKSSLDDMIAFVDEYGNPTDTPPDPDQKEEIEAEDIELSPPKKGREFEDDPIRQGTVTFFNDSKGFGFIKDSETKEDIFVHINNSIDEIAEGNLVTFEVEMGPKGPSAFNVKLVK
jgi:cold shock CspA family protein